MKIWALISIVLASHLIGLYHHDIIQIILHTGVVCGAIATLAHGAPKPKTDNQE